jgi:hypothetical protein
MASISIAVNSGLLHAIVSDGGVPKTVNILAQKTGAEPSFLGTTSRFMNAMIMLTGLSGRVARHLAAERLILETGTSEYAPTAATHILTSPAMEGMAKIM